MQELQQILDQALQQFAAISDEAELEQVKARYLGKEGSLTVLLKGLGKLSAEERPAAGARINQVKQGIEAALQLRRDTLQHNKLEQKLAAESLDVTLPGRGLGTGGLHPVTRTLERIEMLFHSMGYAVAEGPEIESDFYNFTALNIPEDHPARAMHDTFYIDKKHVLRTHTSPILDTLHAGACGEIPASGDDAGHPHYRAWAGSIAWIPTPPIRRCSTRSKVCG